MQEKSIKHYFSLKLAVLAGLIFILFLGAVFLFLLPVFEQEFIKRKKETLHAITQVAISHIQYHVDQAEKGAMGLQDAQARALEDIQIFRYGKQGKDYFWILDMSGKVLMHPYRVDLVGQENNLLQDESARQIMLEFVDIITEKGSGYTEYLWQWQDDPSRVIEKVSYVEGVKPWQWIIGTGFYRADVREDLAKLTRHVLLVLIITLSVIVLLLFMIVYKAIVANAAHQRATQLLQQSERRFRELAELLPEGIFECDLTFQITYVNSRALEMFGYSEGDLDEGFNCLQVFSGENRVKAEKIFQLKILGKETGPSEYFVTRSDGTTFPVLLHSNCIIRGGTPVGMRGIIVNISRQKKIEEELKHHRDNLEHHVAERTRELEAALQEVNILSGLIPICAKCKKVRDDKGFWKQVETYIEQHTEANFSHSMCPDCEEVLYGDEDWFKRQKNNG